MKWYKREVTLEQERILDHRCKGPKLLQMKPETLLQRAQLSKTS